MLVLVRHSPTKWNTVKPEILRGNIDLPITQWGREEAQRNGGKLQRFNISEVRSSDYARDSETGSIIAQTVGAKHVISPAMRPWNIGTLSGKSIDSVWPTMKGLFRNPNLAPPSGETYGNFIGRWAPVIRNALNETRSSKQNLVLIVQGSVIRSLPTILRGKPPSTAKWEFVKPAEMIFLQ